MNILFIGNSYTFFNKMPEEIFAPLARERGMDVCVTSVTRGGWYLSRFADPENEEGKRLREVIAGKHYDCVILQDQSCNPVRNEENFLRAVGELQVLLAPQTDHFVLYCTWGRCEGSDMLAQLSLSSAEMTARLCAVYHEAGDRHGMKVADVGLAFSRYAERNPQKELYNDDLSHPSLLGSRIAAETILDAVISVL